MPEASPHPWIDCSTAPIYKHVLPDGASVAETQKFCRAWETMMLPRTDRYGVIMDLRQVLTASSDVRKALADMDNNMASHDKKYCCGVAFVVTSKVVRGMVTAVFWLSRPSYPYKFFPTEEEGRAWLTEQMR